MRIKNFLPAFIVSQAFTKHWLITLIWFTPLIITALNMGSIFGIPLLFYEPEYLGSTGFLSYFILGSSFSWASFMWMLVLFLSCSRDLPFLAAFRFPLVVFLINASFLPIAQFLLWCILLINFHIQHNYSITTTIKATAGFTTGFILMALLILLYLIQRTPELWKAYASKILHPAPPQKPRTITITDHEHESFLLISTRLRLRRTRIPSKEAAEIWTIFLRRQHISVLLLFLLSYLFLMGLGWVSILPFFRLPSSSIIYVLTGMTIAIGGAIQFWFGKLAWLIILVLSLTLAFLTSNWKIKSRFSGIPYEKYVLIDSLNFHNKTIINSSKNHMFKTLKRWYAKQRARYPTRKPTLVLVCVSGGGLRSALWTFTILQRLDSSLNGEFMHHTFLITGASGGMLGATLYRELWYRHQKNSLLDPHNPAYREWISKDLLNPVVSAWVLHDILFPFPFPKWRNVPVDRGILFELALIENTEGLLRKTLADYKLPEENAQIPMIVFSPVIASTGQLLLISTHSLAYTHTLAIPPSTSLLPHTIDFLFLLGDSGLNLTITSALRASASFPLIMPSMHLPTHPPLLTTDAGVRDNYGVEPALLILYPFLDWINRRLDKVIIILIRDLAFVETGENKPTTLYHRLRSSFLGMIAIQDHKLKLLLALWQKLLKDKLITVPFIYKEITAKRASLSWHLTNYEKNDILNAAYRKDIEESIRKVKQLLGYHE